MEDLPFPEMMEGEDSLLASDDVTVVPGHHADASRPILLGVTKGWNGKQPRSFTMVMISRCRYGLFPRAPACPRGAIPEKA